MRLVACVADLEAYQRSGLPVEKTAEPPEVSLDSFLVARSPSRSWNARPTRMLSQFPEIPLTPSLDRFGAIADSQRAATGFFHTRKIENRWWFVAPEGHLFIHTGVTSVKMLRSAGAKAAFRKRFTTEEKWASSTSQLLLQLGFNCLGPWSDRKNLPCPDTPLVYTKIWNFMSAYRIVEHFDK